MTQREDPEAKSAPAMRELGAMVSGGALHSFRRGWALDIWSQAKPHKAHFFVRMEAAAFARADCGLLVPVRSLYGQGNYERCKRCAGRRRG